MARRCVGRNKVDRRFATRKKHERSASSEMREGGRRGGKRRSSSARMPSRLPPQPNESNRILYKGARGRGTVYIHEPTMTRKGECDALASGRLARIHGTSRQQHGDDHHSHGAGCPAPSKSHRHRPLSLSLAWSGAGAEGRASKHWLENTHRSSQMYRMHIFCVESLASRLANR